MYLSSCLCCTKRNPRVRGSFATRFPPSYVARESCVTCHDDVCAPRQSTKNPDFAVSSFVIACAMQPKGYRLDATLYRTDLHKRMHTSSKLECAQTTGKKGSPVPPAHHWWVVFLSIATCVRGKMCRMIDRTIMASFGKASYVYLYCSLGVSRMRTRWSNVAMAAQARTGI